MYMYMYDVLKIRAIWLAEISRDGNPRLQKKKLPAGQPAAQPAMPASSKALLASTLREYYKYHSSAWTKQCNCQLNRLLAKSIPEYTTASYVVQRQYIITRDYSWMVSIRDYLTDIQIFVIGLVELTSRDIHYNSHPHRRSKSHIHPWGIVFPIQQLGLSLFPMFLSSRAPLLKQRSICAKGCDPIMSNDLCIRANKPKTCEVWNCWCSKTLIS